MYYKKEKYFIKTESSSTRMYNTKRQKEALKLLGPRKNKLLLNFVLLKVFYKLFLMGNC